MMQLSLVLQHSIGDPDSGSTDTHQILFIAKFTQMSATAILPRCLSLSVGVYVNNGKFNPKLWYYIAIDSIRWMLRWSASNRSFIVHRTIALCASMRKGWFGQIKPWWKVSIRGYWHCCGIERLVCGIYTYWLYICQICRRIEKKRKGLINAV